MSYRNIILPLMMLALAGCNTRQAPEIKHTALPETFAHQELASDKKQIENEYLKLTFFPQICGGVENITLKDQNLPLLWGGTLVKFSNGPLMVYSQATGVLFNEKLWRHNDAIISNMELRKITPDSATLYCYEYGAYAAELLRNITLEKDALCVNFDVALKFKSAPKAGYTSPWLNLMPSGDISWVAAIPAKGGDAVNSLGQRTDFPATGIYRGGWHGPNTYFAPVRRWVAVSSPEKRVALALIQNNPPEKCTLYSWIGRLGKKTGRTIEFILPGVTLDKNLSGSYHYQLAIFPGITDLREIIGNTAVGLELKGNELLFTFSVCRETPARKVVINYAPAGKKATQLLSAEIPRLKPGSSCTLSCKVPAGYSAEGLISGTLGKENFELLKVITKQK